MFLNLAKFRFKYNHFSVFVGCGRVSRSCSGAEFRHDFWDDRLLFHFSLHLDTPFLKARQKILQCKKRRFLEKNSFWRTASHIGKKCVEALKSKLYSSKIQTATDCPRPGKPAQNSDQKNLRGLYWKLNVIWCEIKCLKYGFVLEVCLYN